MWQPVLSRKSSLQFSHGIAEIGSLDRGERASNLTLMLPVTLQFIIAMIASAINGRLQRKLDYVEEERHILRKQLDAATGIKSCRSPPTSADDWPPPASCSRQFTFTTELCAPRDAKM